MKNKKNLKIELTPSGFDKKTDAVEVWLYSGAGLLYAGICIKLFNGPAILGAVFAFLGSDVIFATYTAACLMNKTKNKVRRRRAGQKQHDFALRHSKK